MRTAAIIVIIGLLLTVILAPQAEAKGKSVTFAVSCTIPERLEVSAPKTQVEMEETELIEPQITGVSPSKIQTQEIRALGNKKAIVYTIIGR